MDYKTKTITVPMWLSFLIQLAALLAVIGLASHVMIDDLEAQLRETCIRTAPPGKEADKDYINQCVIENKD